MAAAARLLRALGGRQASAAAAVPAPSRRAALHPPAGGLGMARGGQGGHATAGAGGSGACGSGTGGGASGVVAGLSLPFGGSRRAFCSAAPGEGEAPQAEDGAAADGKEGESKKVSRRHRPMDETVRTFLNPAHFFALLRSHGTSFFAGVPDSLLKDVCAFITDNVPAGSHVIAANEGTALATAAGHYLATGNVACVYLQNSGLGNTVNPLLSLCSHKVYSIPVLLLVGWRGEPGKKDEPQHLLQGKLTPSLLDQMNVPYEILPDYAEGTFEALDKAYTYMRKEKAPFALLVKKQTFEKYRLSEDQGTFSGSGMMYREEILEQIVSMFPTEPLVTTTGFTSREIFELRAMKGQSHEQDFLTVGSMGHCSSISLGIALARPRLQVLCVDGDGAAIMHLGSLVTVGKAGLGNFKHVLVNNAVHDSVGGQPTGARNVDFPAIAMACGYRVAERVTEAAEIGPALQRLKDGEGPYFLEIQALPGAREDLGRPTTTTHQNKEAFMEMLASR